MGAWRGERNAATESLACVTELPKSSSGRQLRKKKEKVDAQHWTGPVLQELDMPEVWLLRAATYIILIGINNKSNSEVKLTSNRRSVMRRWQRRQASGEALRVRFGMPRVKCSGVYENSEYGGEFHDAQDLEGKDWPIQGQSAFDAFDDM